MDWIQIYFSMRTNYDNIIWYMWNKLIFIFSEGSSSNLSRDSLPRWLRLSVILFFSLSVSNPCELRSIFLRIFRVSILKILLWYEFSRNHIWTSGRRCCESSFDVNANGFYFTDFTIVIFSICELFTLVSNNGLLENWWFSSMQFSQSNIIFFSWCHFYFQRRNINGSHNFPWNW